jgi:sialate O-acetylesterase
MKTSMVNESMIGRWSRRSGPPGVTLVLAGAVSMLLGGPVGADVVLPHILGSGMVMQRQSEVRCWGRADAGEAIKVTGDWLPAAIETTAGADGRWQVRLRTQAAGGPHQITIKGRNTVVLNDILFGEVWLGSGQSNMKMPLRPTSNAYTGVHDWEQELKAADHPQIRLFHVGQFSSKEPLDDVQPGCNEHGVPCSDRVWKPCSADALAGFSAVAYFFARELHDQLGVPVGIIDSSWGASSAEEWTPAEGLQALGYTRELAQTANAPQNDAQRLPTRLYNGMIHPVAKFGIRGVIWYQGESNAGRAPQYTSLLTTLLAKWREAFDSEFSFHIAQLSSFNGPADDPNAVGWGPLREAQADLLAVPKTGLAVTTDVGDPRDIHPKNKRDVGRRLALLALAKDYGKNLVHSGPCFKSVKFASGRAIVEFSHPGSGLMAARKPAPDRPDPPQPVATLDGFALRGEAEQSWHWAEARIEGDTVVLSSPEVPKPAAVRYNFLTNASRGTLYNKEGLPAAPFRTDR